MDRYADGDAAAFPILYDAIAPRIEGLVRRRTRDPTRDRRHRATDVRAHSPRARDVHPGLRRPVVGVQDRAQPLRRPRRAGLARAGVDGRDGTPIRSSRRSPRSSTPSASRRRARRWRASCAPSGACRRKQQLALELVRVEGILDGRRGREPGGHAPGMKMSVFRGAAALREAVLEAGDSRRSRATRSPAGRGAPRGVT